MLTNCHSPHSLASVKDMYVEMGFPLNLYRHERRILLDRSLDLEVSQLDNFILNFVLCRHVSDRWQLTTFDALALAGLKSLWDRLY